MSTILTKFLRTFLDDSSAPNERDKALRALKSAVEKGGIARTLIVFENASAFGDHDEVAELTDKLEESNVRSNQTRAVIRASMDRMEALMGERQKPKQRRDAIEKLMMTYIADSGPEGITLPEILAKLAETRPITPTFRATITRRRNELRRHDNIMVDGADRHRIKE